jgi:hypothetical protein
VALGRNVMQSCSAVCACALSTSLGVLSSQARRLLWVKMISLFVVRLLTGVLIV